MNTRPHGVHMEARDYQAEMIELVDGSIPLGQAFRLPDIATSLIDLLRVADPDLLAGWMDARAYFILESYMQQRLKNQRNALPSREQIKRSAFAFAAERYGMDGNAGTFLDAVHTPLTKSFVVNANNLRKPMGMMRREDLSYIAERWADAKDQAGMRESFWRAVAKKVGDKQVDEVFDNETLDSLYRSFTGHDLTEDD